MVLIERGLDNEVRKLSPIEAFTGIMPHALYPEWHETLTITAMDAISDFVEHIPVYRLKCRPDEDAVNVLYHELFVH